MNDALNVNDALDKFMAFTYLFRYCRPKMPDFFVYEVDSGSETDFNLVMLASKFLDGKAVGEFSELTISKTWVMENLEKILDSVPELED